MSAVNDEVWAGAPGRDVSDQVDAGSVGRFTAGAAAATGMREFTQNSPGVPGAAEARDRFGEVLGRPYFKSDEGDERPLTWWTWTVIVGVPHEDVGQAFDAGMILELMDDPSHVQGGGAEWTQNSLGVPGRGRGR